MPNKYSIFSLIKNSFSYHENWQKAWRDPEPKKQYDVVIVGGGGHGLATAFYLAKKHNIKLIVDNTFSPLSVTPSKLGADIIIHSITKFI